MRWQKGPVPSTSSQQEQRPRGRPHHCREPPYSLEVGPGAGWRLNSGSCIKQGQPEPRQRWVLGTMPSLFLGSL